MKKTLFPRRLALAGAVALISTLPMTAKACSYEPTVGDVCIVVMNWCPQNYMVANGQTLTITQYAALYSLLGFTYGGDGRTTFALPDLRGRAPVGTGTSPEFTGTVLLGQKSGQPATTLSIAQMPTHTHAAAFTPTTGTVQVTIPAQAGTLAVDASVPVATSPTGALNGTTVALGAGQTGYLAGIKGTTGSDDIIFTGPYTTANPGTTGAKLKVNAPVTGNAPTAAATVPVQTVTGGTVVVGANGASTAVSTQSPSLGMTYCVAVNGIYPDRP